MFVGMRFGKKSPDGTPKDRPSKLQFTHPTTTEKAIEIDPPIEFNSKSDRHKPQRLWSLEPRSEVAATLSSQERQGCLALLLEKSLGSRHADILERSLDQKKGWRDTGCRSLLVPRRRDSKILIRDCQVKLPVGVGFAYVAEIESRGACPEFVE